MENEFDRIELPDATYYARNFQYFIEHGVLFLKKDTRIKKYYSESDLYNHFLSLVSENDMEEFKTLVKKHFTYEGYYANWIDFSIASAMRKTDLTNVYLARIDKDLIIKKSKFTITKNVTTNLKDGSDHIVDEWIEALKKEYRNDYEAALEGWFFTRIRAGEPKRRIEAFQRLLQIAGKE